MVTRSFEPLDETFSVKEDSSCQTLVSVASLGTGNQLIELPRIEPPGRPALVDKR